MDNKSPSPAVGAFIAAALVAGASLLAIIATEALERDFDRPRRRTRGPEPKRPAVPDLAHIGETILKRPYENQPLQEFLKQKYLGLHLIGRTGGRVPGNKVDALATELGHFHQQCFAVTGHDTDRALVEWYETVGVGKRIPLAEILGRSPAVDNSFNGHLYIASAITGDLDPSLTYELTEEEWLLLKRHFNI